ncbi:MAG: class I SAM-dependent methyltransferase [Candidatus Firestonebacteria bacterium]|nr:class I SAM-dependent methyltransferase [Candidatus Firestonebacteria bacterium]
MKMQNNKDAFGRAVWAYYTKGVNFLLAKRDDGFLSDAGGVKVYFDGYKKWPIREKRAFRLIKKNEKVLDIGCGVGRHSIYLQSKRIDVTGIDNSPLAIKVCKLRGLKKAKILRIEDINEKTGCFDTLLLLCNNFGLFGTEKKAKALLKRFYKLTPPGAKIITESYDSNTAYFRDYRAFNRKKKRHPGSFRVKLCYGRYETSWFDYIRVSRIELKEMVKGTGWQLSRVFPTKDYSYVAVLTKNRCF